MRLSNGVWNGVVVVDPLPPSIYDETWGSVKVGDIIAYESGAIFHIESVFIEEEDCTTFLVRCIVGGANELREFGDLGLLCVSGRLPPGMIVTRG